MTRHILPLILLASACLAQTVPLRWAAELGDARPARFTLVRGDTVELAADLFAEGRPYIPAAADASLLWQTNGMGVLWWEAPASVASNRVSATWTPAMDTGAASYLAHFRVGSSTGSVFRAYARLAMQHGPGDPVNALPLPVPVLDFAKVVVTNAPWGEGGGGLTTNDVRAIAIDATGVERVPEDREVFVDGGLFVLDDIRAYGFDTFNLDHDDFYGWLHSHEWRYDPDNWDPGPDREIAVKGDLTPLARTDSLGTAAYEDVGSFAARTNLPPLSASSTVGDLVDAFNAIANALRKEDP